MNKQQKENSVTRHLLITLPPCGVLAQESRHGADFAMPAHRHNCLSVLAAVAGSGECRADEQTIRLQADEMLLIPVRMEHQVLDDPAQPLTLFVLYFGGDMAKEAARLLAVGKRARHLALSREAGVETRRILRRLLHEQEQHYAGREAMVRALALELLVLCARGRVIEKAQEERSEVVENVARHLRERYYEQWSLPEAARLAGLSVRRFSDLFRKSTGNSFVQYLNRARIEEAQKRLESGNQKISSVCFEVGFEDLSHFYKVYRQLTGHAPGSHRRKNNKSGARQ